ncbi:MAG: peptide/nickel transport system ATP-binding protein [Methylophilaceae bacterium]|jgi:peptide/nickel transport system ATP-binding protein
MADILSIEHLNVALKKTQSKLLINDISFKLASGKTTCIVGESGSGKSLTALTIMGLLSNQLIATGRVLFNGVDLTTLDNKAMQKIRGAQIGMIFQEPMTSLNPVLTVGFQIGEVLTAHQALKGNALKASVTRLLTQVGIPETRASSYPDELSGGQRQRVMVAMSIACEPALLIADEPTTALDVTVQAQILTLLDELKSRMNMAMLFITHDFGVVSDIADDVVVMFRGEIVEAGPKEQVLSNPQHPYTKALLDCVPDAAGEKVLKPIDYAWLNHHELSNSEASA